jgi:hypothetical protein
MVMVGQMLDCIVDSLSEGKIGLDDFMRAVEEHVTVLRPENPAFAPDRQIEDGLANAAE